MNLNEVYLNEELSISDHVIKVTEKVYEIVMDHTCKLHSPLINFDFIGRLDIKQKIVFYKNGGATGRCGSDTAKLDENNRLVSYMEIEGNFSDPIDDINSEMDYIKSTIHHEVEHLYQAYCKLINKNQHKISDFYRIGIAGINSFQQHQNHLISFVSHIYYAENQEQDAMVNGMYNSLINIKNDDDLFEKYKDTQAGTLLQILKKAYSVFSDRTTQLDYRYKHMILWLKDQGVEFNLDKTLKQCSFRMRRLESKIGKVLTKIKKDKQMVYSEICLNFCKDDLKRLTELMEKV